MNDLALTPPLFWHADAHLSECKRFRWSLSRWLDDSKPFMTVLMHNPSTADTSVDDPTINRLKHWCAAWGYGGFIVVNLLPLRTPDPRLAVEWWNSMEPADPKAWPMLVNMQALQTAAQSASTVLVAHGALHHSLRAVALGALRQIGWNIKAPLMCLGTTMQGYPLHPMARGRWRVPDNVQPQPFHWSPK